MRRFGTSLAIGVSTLLLVSLGFAQQTSTTSVPNLIRYGGVLKDAQGALVSSATAGVTFAIYKRQDGGVPVWTEMQNVTSDASGQYSVLLGSTMATGLPGDLFSQQEERWLGVQVQGQAEQPRVMLVSVPYAFKAHEAETLDGKSISDFVLAKVANSSANASNGNQAGSSTTNPSQSTKPGVKTGAASQGPTNFSGSTADQIVGVTQGGTGVGVNAIALTAGVLGTATATSGASYGLHGIATGKGGVAVLGEARSSSGGTVGLKGSSSSTAGTGMRGIATASTGATIGISSYVASPAGIAAVFNNAAGGKIISGQNNGVEKFFVDGIGNVNSAAGTYQIGGSNVLTIGSPADDNLFLGVGAGINNVAGSGRFNVFTGFEAGEQNTTGSFNTFYGLGAGGDNSTGSYNTFSGYSAGYYNTTGSSNTFYGVGAGEGNTTGTYNTFSGMNAGTPNTTGSYNTISGGEAGFSTTTGSNNTFYGSFAGYNNTTGANNTFYGSYAGDYNGTGNNNIYLGNPGPNSGTESNTIRIGGDNGNGYGSQTAAYIAGIYGSTSASGVPVYINADGKLGTLTSSLRFKEQVRDMGDSTSALMKLRPVTFLYKPEYAKGDRTLQYGLIAEEVAKVYPELVAYDNDGQPYTVRYQYITTMLLNEVQKQCRRAEQQNEVIETQQKQLEEQRSLVQAQTQEIETLKQQLQLQNATLQQRLSRLESMIGSEVQTVAQAKP